MRSIISAIVASACISAPVLANETIQLKTQALDLTNNEVALSQSAQRKLNNTLEDGDTGIKYDLVSTLDSDNDAYNTHLSVKANIRNLDARSDDHELELKVYLKNINTSDEYHFGNADIDGLNTIRIDKDIQNNLPRGRYFVRFKIYDHDLDEYIFNQLTSSDINLESSKDDIGSLYLYSEIAVIEAHDDDNDGYHGKLRIKVNGEAEVGKIDAIQILTEVKTGSHYDQVDRRTIYPNSSSKFYADYTFDVPSSIGKGHYLTRVRIQKPGTNQDITLKGRETNNIFRRKLESEKDDSGSMYFAYLLGLAGMMFARRARK
ncbi:type 1 periplasmic-binding domain-containing protein [Algicola sagamiensis]|uniref:hypothetical protein n=1 Tax=Algicola sagamiensis TaxID=163869 RepID=UPI00036E829B|nr:hypothetical protein [Algicola sagamiensis]